MAEIEFNDGLQQVESESSANWVSLKLAGGPLQTLLETARDALLPVVELSNQIVAITKDLLEVLVNLVVDITDPQVAALQAVIDLARAALEDLTGGASIYFLGVPVSRTDVAPSATILYEKFPGEGFDYTELATASDLQGSGGNYGYMQTVVESLHDQRDTLRPRFSQDAYVAGIAVVYGAENYLDVLTLIGKLKQLFTNGPKSTTMAESIDQGPPLPYPKDLRAELTSGPDTTELNETIRNRYVPGSIESPYAVRVAWEGPEGGTTQYIPEADLTVRVKTATVWRSENPFPANFSESLLEADPALDIEELATFDYDIFINDFYDVGIELGKTYYYAVGFALIPLDDDGNEVEGSTVSVSKETVAFPVPEEPSKLFPRRGIPPDWFIIPSPTALIPAVEQFARRMNDVLDSLESRLKKKSDSLKDYIESLQEDIDRYERWYNEISSTVTQLLDALDWPEIYIGATAFAGQGGNDFMVNHLGTALFNTANDPAAPPFPTGRESVGGFVLMAGAETPGALQGFKTIMELFMGISIDTGAAVSAAQNAYEEAVEAIGEAIEEINEQICLNDDLTEALSCPADEAETSGFDASMEPADGDTSCTGA